LEKDNRFSDVRIEKTISDGSSWRKPDLQANFNNKKFVFEIQISNTFLSVIVARELFYRDMDIPLIWIFGEFDKRDTQFFEKDIFYHHNGNLFVSDEDTYKKSIDYKGTTNKDIACFLNNKNYFKETKYNNMIKYLFDGMVL